MGKPAGVQHRRQANRSVDKFHDSWHSASQFLFGRVNMKLLVHHQLRHSRPTLSRCLDMESVWYEIRGSKSLLLAG